MQLKHYNHGLPLLNANDFILCPRCKKHLYTVIKNVYVGDVLKGSLFENADGIPPLRDGMRTESFCCGTSWFINGSLFTQKGWVPRNPYTNGNREDLQ